MNNKMLLIVLSLGVFFEYFATISLARAVSDNEQCYEISQDKIDYIKGEIDFFEKYLSYNPSWRNEAWILRAKLYSVIGVNGPMEALKYYNNGVESAKNGKFSDAIDYYRQAINADAFSPWPANNLSWVLSTCSDIKLRDPISAIKYSKQSMEQIRVDYADFIGTLAAAYASYFQFDKAIELCKKALSISYCKKHEQMLKCYESKSIFVDYSDPPMRETSEEGLGEMKWKSTKLTCLFKQPGIDIVNNNKLKYDQYDFLGLNCKMELLFEDDMLYKISVLYDNNINDNKLAEILHFLAEIYGESVKMIYPNNGLNKSWETEETKVDMMISMDRNMMRLILSNKEIMENINRKSFYKEASNW